MEAGPKRRGDWVVRRSEPLLPSEHGSRVDVQDAEDQPPDEGVVEGRGRAFRNPLASTCPILSHWIRASFRPLGPK